MIISRLLPGLSAGLFFATTLFGSPVPHAPQFDEALPPLDFPTEIKCGKTLVMPVAASNADGGILVYSATSDNPSIMVRVRTGNPTLRLAINHEPSLSGSDVAISGTMDLLLFREFTPITTGIIGGIAQSGNYDGMTFFRIGKGFMVQGGGYNDSSTGILGKFNFENEFNLPLIFTGKGQLAMANRADENNAYMPSNSCQFFITDSSPRHLDLGHTIFGQLVRGWETFAKITNVEGESYDPENPDGNIRPTSPVTITSAKVIKTNDAVLLLSATAKGSANITLSIFDPTNATSGTSSRTFQVSSLADGYNDPPILTPVADSVAATKGKRTILLKSQDLEMDEASYLGVLSDHYPPTKFSSDIAGATLAGQKLTVTGTHPVDYQGPMHILTGVSQSNSDSSRNSSSRLDSRWVQIGFGDKALIPQPTPLRLQSGTTPTLITVGAFLDKDPYSQAGDFSNASNEISWGDGTVTTGTAISIEKDPSIPRRFTVKATHAYPNLGFYPVQVSIQGNLGATAKFTGTAHVSGSNFFASGLALTNNGGNIAKKIVAQFTDLSPVATSLYETRIDWGDGVTTSGTVVKATRSTTSFSVLGSHRYKDSAIYPVHVTISPIGREGDLIHAWSTAKIKGINKPAFLPPFPQGTLSVQLGYYPPLVSGSASTAKLQLHGLLTVRNNGNRATTEADLAFYYQYTPKGGGAAKLEPLSYMGQSFLRIPPLKPGRTYKIFMWNQGPTKNTALYGPEGSGLSAGAKSDNRYILFETRWIDTMSKEVTGRYSFIGPLAIDP